MDLIHLNKEMTTNFIEDTVNNNEDEDSDLNFIQRLGVELQKRIGTLPKVELFTLMMSDNVPGKLIRMLRVKPKSYSEISRTIRAARTMKLTVRACGHLSSSNLILYGTNGIVLIDCIDLSDSPRIQFVNMKCKNSEKEIQGLKLLSCVSINELINYQISHNIEINQIVDTYSIFGTVVGAIVSTQPGVVGPGGAANGGCLTDEVIAIRIVDCHGDLIEYSSENEIMSAVSNLGLLGVVYDITLRYNPITLTKVNYHFYKWSDLLNTENTILKDAITINQSTEIIYLPYNSCHIKSVNLESNQNGINHNDYVSADISNDNNSNNNNNNNTNNNDNELVDLKVWNIEEDEVLLRTTKRFSQDYQDNYIAIDMGNNDHINDNNNYNEEDPLISYDSDPQQFVYLLDQVFGPFIEEFIEQPDNIPKLLKRAHHYLRCKYFPHSTTIQYTPWALNSFGKLKEPLRILKFTMETDNELNQFIMAIRTILDILHKLANDKLLNYSINLGLRIQFTPGTNNGHLLGVGLESDKKQSDCKNSLLAHITFMGITQIESNNLWNEAAKQIILTLLTKIPSCMPQWKTEWHNKQLLFSKFREALQNTVEPLKKLISLADRDGMFMNEYLASIFYSKPTIYQNLYQSQRTNYFATI
ncbi:unnamed protein product [Schistosoma turkestanicum]|nr:unnamed protein product [Schistosoma turkestanicum]